MNGQNALPTATVMDTTAALLDVVLPTIAKGPIIRRPKAVAMAERLGLDDRAVRRMKKLDDKYESGPLLLRLPFRRQAVILRPEHVHFVLENSPEPFATASSAKRAALAHFEPRNVLISKGPERSVRRALQEQVLDTQSPVHRLADSFMPIISDEAAELLRVAGTKGELVWDDFIASWYRVVRRVVFGDDARDDHELTDMIARLRSDANWAFLKPKRRGLRKDFLRRIYEGLQAAPPGTLAFTMANRDEHKDDAPANQIPQWLFAFDPAGMAAFRALAVLATHNEQSDRARQEIREDTSGRQYLPYLRSSVLESLRLWPTTPLLLRQTVRDVHWDDGTMPKNCGVLIFAPYFHRDERHLPHAHSFRPEQWLDRQERSDWALVPFSDGPAVCPGRQLVLMLTSAMLSHLMDGRRFTLTSKHDLAPGKPLPGTLNNYSLRFAAEQVRE